jgi:hypothetical protein
MLLVIAVYAAYISGSSFATTIGETSTRMLQEMERFLGEHLGPSGR